jgi:hypothetical protein
MRTQNVHASGRLPVQTACVMLLALLALVGCNVDPQQRPGDVFDGSAQWALDIARPLIDGFASDAELYTILGAVVFRDGRLPANTGTWSFVAWSPSRQEEFQVTVKHDGTTTTSTREQDNGPSSDGQPVPDNWVNSPAIFDATAPHRGPDVVTATLVVFNISTHTTPRVWGINYDSGPDPNHYVDINGNYLGTSPP